LYSNSELLHGQELAQAAEKAKKELAADKIRLKFDPIPELPDPLPLPTAGPEPVPDVAPTRGSPIAYYHWRVF
jgi:hypothetical protein